MYFMSYINLEIVNSKSVYTTTKNTMGSISLKYISITYSYIYNSEQYYVKYVKTVTADDVAHP